MFHFNFVLVVDEGDVLVVGEGDFSIPWVLWVLCVNFQFRSLSVDLVFGFFIPHPQF